MINPVATYRLQFHKAFSFRDFEKLIPYFQKLGVGTIYASPILESTPGSTHGYDGVNPNIIDPELGSEEELRELGGSLKKAGIGWLQDIVPNHMAFHSGNIWLMDVMEKGAQSRYAAFFDIAWNSRLFQGRLMVPFLTHDLDQVIADGNLSLSYTGDRLVMNYEGAEFPLGMRSYITILALDQDYRPESVRQLLTQIREVHEVEDPHVFSARWDEVLLQLRSLAKIEEIKNAIDSSLAKINGDPRLLTDIADQQYYVLCNWQKTDETINFRRFFTVNGLICLNMQDENVFEEYHRLVKSLVDDGVFQGLRIDHIDGLFDPETYLEKLRALSGKDTYIIAEKILEKDETLPGEWPLEGTTGYEFLAMVNNVFTNQAAEKQFTDFYQELTGDSRPVRKQLLEKKADILEKHMGGELENLYRLFIEFQLADPETIDAAGKDNLKKAIGEFLIHCPVYRYYAGHVPFSETEAGHIKAILEEVRQVHESLSAAVGILEKVLLEMPAERDEDYSNKVLEFYRRCMQFSGPLMAKGGEDTLMYTYNRFVGHNEVGDFPDRFGISVREFHKKMYQRRKNWPFSLNATSTHDTKRGEDVRARLNILTDLPGQWISAVKEWKERNVHLKNNQAGPDKNDEYLIYQTLAGALPMPGEEQDDFSVRLKEYLQKALREAKTHTTWAEPNEDYEKSAGDFADRLLDRQGPFWEVFERFYTKIADYGIVNSLAQLVLKFTCPGIPDVYQGCELWDFSLVDPDNRRPVDFEKRAGWLSEFEHDEEEQLLDNLWEKRSNAQVKLWLTHRLLQLRKNNPFLFASGDYLPLKVKGAYKDFILAFARKQKKDVYVVVVPLHSAILCEEQQKDFFSLDWKDTSITLPDNLSPEWQNILTGSTREFQGKLAPDAIFKGLPLAILKGSRLDSHREAGILLHITSLASPFGIGDLGPEAFAFADFLARSNQKIWQILPLNPIEAAQDYSPYSALSSRAGNPLLISPELLAADGLLSTEGLPAYHLPQTGKADYDQAEKVKNELLKKAFENFSTGANEFDEELFEAFCTKNGEWIDDFALYMYLKAKHDKKPWYEWPDDIKLRDKQTLEALAAEGAEEIRFVKWQQYTFDKQWKNLKSYCNGLDINLLGDIPFYVSYDSADVWSNRHLFRLDETGGITGVAGVPPDAFSDDGQLWGMPVFNWEALKEEGYQWWIQRLAKNMELFDTIRLDHFRAFADYWEVPGGEKTAVKGEWKLGPGEDFFVKAAAALGSLPFIAEDLGEMSPAVFALRDKLALPGMKVLQFAFDENMPQSDYIPHNYDPDFIVYTGTHDNNTVRGWFRQSEDKDKADRIEKYTGQAVNEENIAGVMARLAYASVGKAVILPLQDVLNLDESGKMNSPGSNGNNWGWRLLPDQITTEVENKLTGWTVLFNRD